MTDLHFSGALVDGSWARDVRVTLDEEGRFGEIVAEAAVDGAEVVRGIALPGLVNLHSHAFQRAMAGLTERAVGGTDTFWSWRDRMYAFLARLGPDDVEAIAEQLFVEMLRHGFTRVTEFHYLRNDPAGRAYDDPIEMGRRLMAAAVSAGIGITLLPTLYAASDFGGEAPTHGQRRFVASVDDILRDVERLLADASPPTSRVGLALHSLRAVPPGPLREAVTALDRVASGAPVHIHVAEQTREVEACLAWSGARPVEWLLENAPVDERWCLVHATHLTVEETERTAGCGAVVGLCPTTEANLGDGIFPFRAFAASGGSWGVGTDSHVSVSPVAELRTLEYGQRLAHRVRNVGAEARPGSTGRALLDAAWAGGARAAGHPSGRLAEGAPADFVVVDPNHAALAGRSDDDLLDSWLFSGEDTPVRDVFVAGRRVVSDGRHPRAEEAARRYRAVARRLMAEES